MGTRAYAKYKYKCTYKDGTVKWARNIRELEDIVWSDKLTIIRHEQKNIDTKGWRVRRFNKVYDVWKDGKAVAIGVDYLDVANIVGLSETTLSCNYNFPYQAIVDTAKGGYRIGRRFECDEVGRYE